MLSEFETPRPALDGAREGALFVAEQLALHQGFGHRRTVDGDERAVAPRAEVVDGARHQFLASAAFAGQQHRRFAGGDLPDHREYGLHRWRCPDQVDQHALVAQLPLQALGFFDEAALRGRPLEQDAERGRLNGFLEEPECAEVVNRGDRRLNVAERRQHDRGRHAPLVAEPLQQFEAIHARHHEIRHQHVEGPRTQLLECVQSVCGSLHFVVQRPDHTRQAVALFFFIVDHQHTHNCWRGIVTHLCHCTAEVVADVRIPFASRDVPGGREGAYSCVETNR